MNISEILRSLLDEYSSVDMAESEFRKMLNEDESLKSDYHDWCEENGYSPKTGYEEYIEDFFENQESMWDILNEYEDDVN